MTRLLASVTDPDEARAARAAGADIIDMKDPAAGALGALPAERIRLCVQALRGHPSSATVGDLPPDPALMTDAVSNIAASGVDYVKVGLFDPIAYAPCIEALARQAAGGLRIVAVLFADLAPDPALLPELARAGLAGVMLDTADKTRGGLCTHMEIRELARFVGQTQALGMLSGLAGSLRLEDIATLTNLRPDYLGFRTALCHGRARTARIDAAAIRTIGAALRRDPVRYEALTGDRAGLVPPGPLRLTRPTAPR